MTDACNVPLTALPREIAALIEGPPPSYRQLYGMVLDGRVPAEQVNGRYRVARADLPTIVATLGLRLKASAEPARRRKVTPSPATVAA